MTLKELRISKGLSQKECAKFLDMSIRNYQNYENDIKMEKTAKYQKIYHKLDSYTLSFTNIVNAINAYSSFNTNVITGSTLNNFYNQVKNYQKRDCYQTLKKFICENYVGKICILYGLRRTGKTTMLFQLLNELNLEKTAYIKIRVSDNMSSLTKDLKTLFDMGIRYKL